MSGRPQISAAQARRIALGAQGFADKRPSGRIDRRHFRKVLDRMGLIQIDSVNVLVRSQELPLFARLGPHPRSLIHDATAAGELFEYWVHEASHVPTDHRHLYRWSMESPRMWRSLERLRRERPGFLDEVERYVTDQGPIVAGELSQRQGPKGPWWDWDDGKVALEVLFHQGRVTARRRPNDFARLYDITERVIPAEILARPVLAERDARKELLVLAARSHGVGTVGDLADYHRHKHCKPLVAELVEEGRLIEVDIEGWKQPAYMHPDAKLPRRIAACALLSPFDPVVWNRDRTERLFGFHYRIEIYVPKPKRQYGYYVLPILLGDQLVGRIDLKADRSTRTLMVQSAWREPGVPESEVAEPIVAELMSMAGWLGLERIEFAHRGDLSDALRRVMPTTPIEAPA
jgi:uncharacterized protein YcaQ